MSATRIDRLPEGWRVCSAEEPRVEGETELSFLPDAHDEADSVSLSLLERGLVQGLGAEVTSEKSVVVRVSRWLTLDEAWALYMVLNRGERAPHWDEVAHYAADVRQGYWPDELPPEKAVQTVYLAVVHGNRDADLASRVERALRVCAHLDQSLSEGQHLLRDALFDAAPQYRRSITELRDDLRLFHEDVEQRAERYWATFPTQPPRRVPLLVLRRPVSRLFKHWARRDPEAPGGAGYSLLLTEGEAGAHVLSADPTCHLNVGQLARDLTEAETERAAEGEDVEWYDGSRHGGTLVAAPHSGSRMSIEEVVRVLRKPLALDPVRRNRSPAVIPWIAVAALVGTLVLVMLVVFAIGGGDKEGRKEASNTIESQLVNLSSIHTVSDDPSEAREVFGAKGDPIPEVEAQRVAKREGSHEGRPRYAVIAGVCRYPASKQLSAPCRDARAVRDLLVSSYGYDSNNVWLFVDDRPEEHGPPTAKNLKRKLEQFAKTTNAEEDSSFLFYYSGHGGYFLGAQQGTDYGVLQPAGFFENDSDPLDHRGWDMQHLHRDIRQNIPSKHVMLVIDACYAGWAGAKSGDDFDGRLRALWRERANVALTAGSKGQRAWEDRESNPVWGGHSAMTAFFLRGLEVERSGYAAADGNHDGIVTDEEIGRFVQTQVPSAVQQERKAKQTPGFFRLDASQVKSGQFLFVARQK